MEKVNSFRWFEAVVLLVLVTGQHWAAAEIQCNDAMTLMIPCVSYLMGGDGTPSGECCSGVQSLAKIAAASQEDRRAICRCFKDMGGSFPINLTKAAQLPQLCHVNLAVAIDPNVDCNTI